MRRIAAPVFVVVALLVFPLFAAAQATTRPASATPAKPQAATPAPAAMSAVETKRALATRLPATKLENVRLEDAMQYLQDSSGANIHVNWRALETVNITREMTISLKLQSLPLRQLLRFVLAEADPEGLSTFYAEDGVIEVTTKALGDERLIVKVYPVEDLLLTIPDFTDAPQFNLQTTNSGGRGGGGGGGQSLFGGQGGGQDQGVNDKATRGQELVQLIMDSVQPDVWRENGGTASIRFFRGKLIVSAPRSVHEQIGGRMD